MQSRCSPHNAKALKGSVADVKVSQIEAAGILDVYAVIAPAVDDKAGHGGIFRLVQNNGFVQRFIAGVSTAPLPCRIVPVGTTRVASITRAGDDLHRAAGVGCQKVIQFCQAGTGKIHSLGGFGGGQGASRVMTELYRFSSWPPGYQRWQGQYRESECAG